MFIRPVAVTALALFITACSSAPTTSALNNKAGKKSETPASKYVERSVIPSNTIESSSNLCVDNFNFLREAGSNAYQTYSKQYIKIGDGYDFLRKNNKIMGSDARQVYEMNLNVKLDTLCNKVGFASFNLVKNKVAELDGI